jgi:hypothetical protein
MKEAVNLEFLLPFSMAFILNIVDEGEEEEESNLD